MKMINFKPKDIVAILALVLIFGLKLAGKDGLLDGAIALILGYYFAHRQNGDDNGI